MTLDIIIDDVLGKGSRLSRRDRSLANAIVFGVLRWRNRLDWIISHFSKTPFKKIDPKILNILRIGLFQVIYLDRIPKSAAVDTSVQMAKPIAPLWTVRYVNGLLRNASSEFENVPLPDINIDPARSLSISKSFPEWLIKRWIERFGIEEAQSFCDAVNTIPPITIRTNTLKLSREELHKHIANIADNTVITRYSSEGLSFTTPSNSIPELKGFRNGWFQVQDEAAQLIAPLLNPAPENHVLDACAGLGGKTAHIAQIMKNRGNIIAMDNDAGKLNKLELEMNRLGITNVSTVQHDLNHAPDSKSFPQFDRILLDAPCSGLGVLRRNPDTKWAINKKAFIKLKKRQYTFLSNLAPLVRPNGILIYSVCSTEPEENEAVINLFLKNNLEFKLVLPQEEFQDKNSVFEQSGYLKTYPHKHGMDGFFAACLQRQK